MILYHIIINMMQRRHIILHHILFLTNCENIATNDYVKKGHYFISHYIIDI